MEEAEFMERLTGRLLKATNKESMRFGLELETAAQLNRIANALENLKR